MRVYLTEKPSVARAVAEYLGASGKKAEGFIPLRNGDVVTWNIGHMLEQAEPDAYLPADKRGRFFDASSLPIIPQPWLKVPKPERDARGRPKLRDGQPVVMAQYRVVIDLLRKASIIVNCGDIDREGQYLADEMIEAAGFPPDGSRKPVERVEVAALDARSLERVFKAPRRSNGDAVYVRRRQAGECRAKADWLVGMNGSRAYSSAARATVPVGRVRTAVVELVIQRDLAIEQFRPVQFYVPVVTLPGGYEVAWTEREEGAADRRGLDEQGRIVDRRVAEAIVQRLLGGQALTVSRCEQQDKRQPPPLPHSLSAITSQMSARHGMTAKAVAAACQSLYERHKAISYIGTDCRYLPLSQHAEAPAVLAGLSGRYTSLMQRVSAARKYACWNDEKVSAHHAIIPTGVTPGQLGADEAKVYEAIARRYLAQFYPEYRYSVLLIEAEALGDRFVGRRKETADPGWHVAEGSEPPQTEEKEEEEAPAERARAHHDG